MSPPPAVIPVIRLASGLVDQIADTLLLVRLFLWDLSLTIYNLFAPLRPADRVVPEGRPGANGLWPQYVAPTETDSRSCCPMINAMANHGILPRDGRNIAFHDLDMRCRETFNIAPTFAFFTTRYAATMLGRDYGTGKLDLADLSAHNCIEHDASLCREDTFHNADQSKPAPRLINALLESASGPNGTLTMGDISRMLSKRRAESKRANGQYSQATSHKIFGASNSALLLTACGGRVKDLYPMLLEERIPDGWQPRVRTPGGITFLTLQGMVLPVELCVEEEVRKPLAALHMGDARARDD
ncbi:hypothetical protein FOMPIDRAFT_99721 [Fomitopsis schrenkii]|uniref:Heme haloperoxidase family profile domain-containing protein n=1 Tax=Fomitopsis schrenkii TaxID=2126942 RepID=S8FKR1_FOMSC|nr:hypothetical protein FOMPIDRAFT_99721 [Fomitopsis schrenkii]